MADKDEKEIVVPATIYIGEADYDFETQTFTPRLKLEGTAKFTIRTNITAISEDGGKIYHTFATKPKA